MSQYKQLSGKDDTAIDIPNGNNHSQELSTLRQSSESGSSSNQQQSLNNNSQGQQSKHNCGSDHNNHQHNHVHSQGDSCGHSHGPGQSCKKKNKERSKQMIQFFTMFMPTNCLILETFWLNEINKDNEFEYYGSRYFLIFILFMCFATYYQCINVKNTPTKRNPPPCDPGIFDPIARNTNICKDCNFWKPMRTKHCRNCGGCQLRMDHHCPWITNCVGLRNNRAFYLFTVYMMAGSVQYCYQTLIYFRYLNTLDNFWVNSAFFYMYWLFTSVILIPICVMLVGLTFFHSLLLINNATTLDLMGGLSLGLPFSSPQRIPPHKRTVNCVNYLNLK